MNNQTVNALPIPTTNEVKFLLTPFNNYKLTVPPSRGHYFIGLTEVTAYINPGNMGIIVPSCDHLMGISRTSNSSGDYTEVQYMATDELVPNGARVWVDGGSIHYESDGDDARAESGIILQVTAKFLKVVEDDNL
ncbi:hypothetical protein [Pseudomonas phage PA1C]|nr:hypothetical protein [Pseudomonas phage PA1C]